MKLRLPILAAPNNVVVLATAATAASAVQRTRTNATVRTGSMYRSSLPNLDKSAEEWGSILMAVTMPQVQAVCGLLSMFVEQNYEKGNMTGLAAPNPHADVCGTPGAAGSPDDKG